MFMGEEYLTRQDFALTVSNFNSKHSFLLVSKQEYRNVFTRYCVECFLIIKDIRKKLGVV